MLRSEIILYFTWLLLWFYLFQSAHSLAHFNNDRNWLSSLRKLVGGGGGSLRDLFKNILKQGVGKGKSCS